MLAPVTARAAEDQDLQELGLILGPEEAVVTTARAPRPTSQIAENVTVITEAQIAELNAHTLADVLQTVPGIQLDNVQTPGSFTFFSIQGANSTHILVLIDGVPQNNLLQSFVSPGMISVQQIERIEIIKGAASATWGQALGGVVNVITKNPNQEKAISGALLASDGKGRTSDLRGELSGTVNRFGYYISGGNLHSNGLLPNNGVNFNNFYGKLTYDLPGQGNITLGVGLDSIHNGLDETVDFHDTSTNSHRYSFLALNYPLDQHFTLNVGLHESEKKDSTRLGSFTPDGSVHVDNDFVLRESTYGANATLAWSSGPHKVLVGLEYEHEQTRQKDELVPDSEFLTDRVADRAGVYTNGAFSFGAFTLLPGVRFDHTDLAGDVTSYTLGATYLLSEKTLLRGYAAKGYSLPIAILHHGPQKVTTGQIGAETSALPYVWLKGTLFYNLLSHVENTDSSLTVFDKQTRKGAEVELRTVPFYSTSFSGGYTYTDARNGATDTHLPVAPLHLAKLALHYDNKLLGLSGVFTGNYVLRYLDDGTRNPNDHGMVCDLSLTQKLSRGDNAPELFFSGHNLFNATQYTDDIYKDTRRWFEGGMRVRF